MAGDTRTESHIVLVPSGAHLVNYARFSDASFVLYAIAVATNESDETGREGNTRPAPESLSPFWKRFPEFTPDPAAPLQDQIDCLGRQEGWGLRMKRKRHIEAVIAEMVLQSDNSSDLKQWQRLCMDVGITDIPSSITKCRKVKSVPSHFRRRLIAIGTQVSLREHFQSCRPPA